MKWKEIKAGARDAVPIIMGYIPIGIAYGILAGKTGLNIYLTVMMSIAVFAGSAQLICVDMLSGGAGIVPIIMMTFLVNLRHLLMSASLSIHFRETRRYYLPLLGFLITDESFAAGSAGIDGHEHKGFYFLGLGAAAYLGWVTSSWLGVSLGRFLPVVESPVLDFVLPAMFIALLVMQIGDRLDIIVALIAGSFSLLLVFLLPGNWNIILATITAATTGVIIERWKEITC